MYLLDFSGMRASTIRNSTSSHFREAEVCNNEIPKQLKSQFSDACSRCQPVIPLLFLVIKRFSSNSLAECVGWAEHQVRDNASYSLAAFFCIKWSGRANLDL